MKVVLAQLTPTADPTEGCDRVCSVISDHSGADLILFPELFVGGYASDDLPERSVAADSSEMAMIAARCRMVGAAVVVGFIEALDEAGQFGNSAACFDTNGNPAGIYRKTHLFGPGEQAGFQAGDTMLLTRLAGRVTGPQICFDVEFPEPSRKLAVAGADLLITIAANMDPYAAEHRLAVQARALDNRLPHLYVNRTGAEGGFSFVGESCAVSASGRVIAELGSQEGVLEVEIPVSTSPKDAQTQYLGQIRPDLNVTTYRIHGEEP